MNSVQLLAARTRRPLSRSIMDLPTRTFRLSSRTGAIPTEVDSDPRVVKCSGPPIPRELTTWVDNRRGGLSEQRVFHALSVRRRSEAIHAAVHPEANPSIIAVPIPIAPIDVGWETGRSAVILALSFGPSPTRTAEQRTMLGATAGLGSRQTYRHAGRSGNV